MIRRNPTLIALTDNDVQDVREAVKQKTQATSAININAKDIESIEDVYRKMAEERKAKAAQTREERLGLA
ncbi:hypothetical protein NLI96_g1494 [Meripilus lineatus]|uniref:Uncharacterized protein n=1 Tax=Meripilus lineatus TaxID=2056292 RepID=A0AAD5YMX3_9APHY|nr:hypothetical protein NLI96_g1494 [Physisporinus lineatus]